MMDRHPPISLERLARFEKSEVGDWVTLEHYLDDKAKSISDEAHATKCEHIRFADALLILIFERWERGILSIDERDRLVRRLYT